MHRDGTGALERTELLGSEKRLAREPRGEPVSGGSVSQRPVSSAWACCPLWKNLLFISCHLMSAPTLGSFNIRISLMRSGPLASLQNKNLSERTLGLSPGGAAQPVPSGTESPLGPELLDPVLHVIFSPPLQLLLVLKNLENRRECK